jgi:hypothetical protein
MLLTLSRSIVVIQKHHVAAQVTRAVPLATAMHLITKELIDNSEITAAVTSANAVSKGTVVQSLAAKAL